MHQATHDHIGLSRGHWAEINPQSCPCRGNGWLLSDYDVWYPCPEHCHGRPHPEADQDYDMDAHRIVMLRAAYSRLRALSGMTSRQFKSECWKEEPHTPQQWVNAAEGVVQDIQRAQELKEAHSRGYDSVLEMHFSDYADEERQERSCWSI